MAAEFAGKKPSGPDYASYPMLSPEDLAPPPAPSVPAYVSAHPAGERTPETNPYVHTEPTSKNAMETVKGVLGKFGKKFGETANKTENLAGNMWQHLKTAPSVTDAAMGRLAQASKVVAEGGYEKIFLSTFETLPGEKLKKTFVCYISTSTGPVIGVLYLSTAKIAFCSDHPLSYKVGDQTEWSYYKVVLPLQNLRSANPTTSKTNATEKYIQVVTVDNNEFWFIGFVTYDSAVKNLRDALLSV